MDHLPQKFPVPELCVPYFEGPQWRREICDLSDWPSHLGWNTELLLRGDLQGKSIDDLLHLLQSWFYLGFIKCFIPTELAEDILVTGYMAALGADDAPRRYITSAFLPDIIRATGESIRWSTAKEKQTWIETLQPAFMSINCVIIHVFTNVLCQNERKDCKAVNLSICLLSLLVNEIIEEGARVSGLQFAGNTELRHWLFYDILIEYNWCPRTASVIIHDFEMQETCYYLSLGRMSSTRNHNHCSNSVCLALQDSSPCEASHSRRCDSKCKLAKPDMEKVCAVIEASGLPLLKLSRNACGKLDVGIEAYRAEIRYHAISHVWADHLTGGSASEINSCRLEDIWRLHETAVRLSQGSPDESYEPDDIVLSNFQPLSQEPALHESYLWIDSLCIPNESSVQHLRNKAVQDMKKIYEQALAVLVLDNDLSKLNPNVTNRELVARFYTSGWMQRLWTWQEGAVNANVWLAMDLDVLVPIKIIAGKMLCGMQGGHDPAQTIVLKALVELLPADPSMSAKMTVAKLASCRNRSTSRMGDETICIASFFGLDVKPLTDIAYSQDGYALRRMKHLVSKLDIARISLLFARGPRLPFEGFQWAPQTLLAPHGIPRSLIFEETSDTLPSSHLLPTGLLVSLPTLVVEPAAHLSVMEGNLVVRMDGFIMVVVVFEPVQVPVLNDGFYLICSNDSCRSMVLVTKSHSLGGVWYAKFGSGAKNAASNVYYESSWNDESSAIKADAHWVDPMPQWCID